MAEGDSSSVPAKKKVKYVCRFKSSWTEEFPSIIQSHVDSNHAFCKACRVDFNIGHGGKDDVSQHVKSQRHVPAAEAQRGTPSMTTYIAKGQRQGRSYPSRTQNGNADREKKRDLFIL